jgi:3-hydroxyacyl-CoA dehydrogenase
MQPVFTNIAMANVSKSGAQAKELGFAQETDKIVFNAHELLYVALREARAGRSRLLPEAVAAQHQGGRAHRHRQLRNDARQHEGRRHDFRARLLKVAKYAAIALCGGDVETGSLVDEEWLLTVERKLFVDLLKNEKTQQRIQHMLETGKPLRN